MVQEKPTTNPADALTDSLRHTEEIPGELPDWNYQRIDSRDGPCFTQHHRAMPVWAPGDDHHLEDD